MWGWRTTVRSARPDWSSVWKRLLRSISPKDPRDSLKDSKRPLMILNLAQRPLGKGSTHWMGTRPNTAQVKIKINDHHHITINIIIRRYIWRWAKWDCLSHDAFHCSKFSRTKPFPTRREIHPNNFVGAVGWSMFYVNFIVCISAAINAGTSVPFILLPQWDVLTQSWPLWLISCCRWRQSTPLSRCPVLPSVGQQLTKIGPFVD